MFSGGAGSWAAAKRVAAEHGTEDLVLLFADTQNEDEDLYRFISDAAANIGAQLIIVADGRGLWDVYRDTRFIGNSRVAKCSELLKQRPSRAWLDANCKPEETTVYVGIDWTETHRLPKIVEAYKPYTAQAPLCEAPFLDKDEVLEWMRREGLQPPRLYQYGFAHNNCGGFCVRSGKAQFAKLLEVFPERYAYHEEQEQKMRELLQRDATILRESRDGQKVNLTLRELRERLERDQQVDDPDDWGGCGCFTEVE